MTTFDRGDFVDYNGEPWTVSATDGDTVHLCGTGPTGPPLGETDTAPASRLRLLNPNQDRSRGKGADIDHIDQIDRAARRPRT